MVERLLYTQDVGGSSPSSPTISITMDILETVRRKLREHGLYDWRVGFHDYPTEWLGITNFTTAKITLLRDYVENGRPEAVQDTILHEIAHALTGPDHDDRWRAACARIGCTAQVTRTDAWM